MVYAIIVSLKNGLASIDFMCIFLGISFFVELCGLIASGLEVELTHKYNSYIFNTYLIFSVLYFSYYYSLVFKKYFKAFLSFCVVILLAIFCLTGVYKERLDLDSVLMLAFFYIIISLFWLYARVKNPTENYIKFYPRFWVSIALLVWSCFFIYRIIPSYIFADKDPELLRFMKILMYIINVIYYGLFLISINKMLRVKNNKELLIIK